MIPQKLTLTNAIGIKAGLGLDTISIDLTTIPDDALVVALRGDNGSGKSTILNLGMTPWREPAHLSENLYSQFSDGAGLRELEWTHGGTLYRTRINIEITDKTRKMRAYLHQRTATGDWVPVELPDHTTSDGKSTTYDLCLSAILGPQALYFLSAFRSQGAPTLAEYENPKQLMRDLLGLRTYEQLADNANEVAKQLRPAYEAVRQDVHALDEKAAEIEDLQSRLDGSVEAVRTASRAKLSTMDAVTVAQTELVRAKAQTADNEAARARRAEIEAEISAVKAGCDAAASENAADRKTEIARHAKAVSDCTGRIKAIEREISTLRARHAEQTTLLDQRDKIEAAEYVLEGLRAKRQEAEQEYQRVVQQAESVRAMEAHYASLVHQRDSLTADGQRLRSQYDRLEKRAGFVAVVPCHGEAPYDQCPALAEAQQAGGEAKTLALELEALRSKVRGIITTVEPLRERILAETVDVPAAEAALARVRDLLATAELTASQRAGLDAAERTAHAIWEDLQTRVTDRVAMQDDVEQAERNHQDRLTDLTDRLGAILDRSVIDERNLQAKLDALPPVSPDDAVRQAEEAVRTADARLLSATTQLEARLAAQAELQARINTLREQLSAGDATRQHAEDLGNEVAGWRLLTTALRGVIDLSIDDAGPAIASIANDLLHEAYGPRFSVRMITQKTLRNGELREAFDLLVLDSETGTECSLLQKSGGETVWINQSLVNAVAIHHQDATGVRYECAFGDEVEDGLTAERKRQFYLMNRAALHRGGYQRQYQVSHDPQAWEVADWVIDLADLRS